MRSTRLVSILLLLQARQQLSAQALADELEVSVRTIYRDVDALSAAGVPVYAEQGRSGGYRLVDGYRTRLTGLTEGEARSLFLVGIPGAARALGLEGDAAGAELKLRAALGPDRRAQADRLRGRFHVDLPGWYADDDTPHLAQLADAVLSDRCVDVTYRRWEAPREVERVLAPYGLVLKNGTWYVVAAMQGREGARTYRVSNILELSISSETFARPAGFDLPAHWQGQLAAFESRRFTDEAVVRVSPGLAPRLAERADPNLARAVAAGTVEDDGWHRGVLPIESVEHAAWSLVRHGLDVEVVSPRELRDALGARGRELVERYVRG